MIKPDEIALMRLFVAHRGALADGVFAHDRISMHEKRACRIYEKWIDRGWADCGVSTRTAWITPEGVTEIGAVLTAHDERATLIAALRAIQPDPEMIARFRASLPPGWLPDE